MVRRWCEEEECESRALPDTVPPKCKKHSTKKCAENTKFGRPCTYNATEGSMLCVNHLKASNGEFHLSAIPNCKYKEIDGCPKKASRGHDVCTRHIEDPEERARERKRAKVEAITKSTKMRQLLMGEISVGDMDDEELLRGQFKDRDGMFSGRPPGSIPRELHDKMTGELFRRVDGRMQARMFDVVDTMLDIATDPDNYGAGDRIKAATWVFERLRGKTPEVLQVQQERPFEIIMTKIASGPRKVRNEIENVEEAEVIEEDE